MAAAAAAAAVVTAAAAAAEPRDELVAAADEFCEFCVRCVFPLELVELLLSSAPEIVPAAAAAF